MESAVKVEDPGGVCGTVDLLCREPHPGGGRGQALDRRGGERRDGADRLTTESEIFCKRRAVSADCGEPGHVGQRRRLNRPDLCGLLHLASLGGEAGGGASRYGRALSRSRRAAEAQEGAESLEKFLKSERGATAWRGGGGWEQGPAAGAEALVGMRRAAAGGSGRGIASLKLVADQEAKVEYAAEEDRREALRRRIESYKAELRRIDAKMARLRSDREGLMRRLDEAVRRLHAPAGSIAEGEAVDSKGGAVRDNGESEEVASACSEPGASDVRSSEHATLKVEANAGPTGSSGYALGQNLGKKKAYDECGNQISKSCHQCQEQHIPFVCQSGMKYGSHTCRASYCLRCLKSWYPGLMIEMAERCCPRCRGLCKCKACLRKAQSLKLLAMSAEERKAMFNVERDIRGALSPAMRNCSNETRESTRDMRGSYNKVSSPLGSGQDELKSKSPNGLQTNGNCDLKVSCHSSAQNGASHTENGWPSDRYRTGQYLGRDKAYDEGGKQISKSCHQCQEQHIPFQCRSGRTYSAHACRASYCERCVRTWYPGMTIDEFEEACPRCRGFCNCKSCLRKENSPKVPQFSPRQGLAHAEHVLQWTGALVKKMLQEHDQEASIDGATLEDVEVERLEDARLNCNRCAASIPDLHRSCVSCGHDLCVQCCRELRRERNIFRVECPQCAQGMKLLRLLGNGPLQALREVAQRYGAYEVNREDGGPFWPWLDGEECAEAATQSANRGVKPWHETQPAVNLRLASNRPRGQQNFIFCPHADDLKPDSLQRGETLRIFQKCIQIGQPVVVRGVSGVMDWMPETMFRATHEVGNKTHGIEKSRNIMVIDCKDRWAAGEVSQRSFFNMYQRGAHVTGTGEEVMLKVKEWPPDEKFSTRLKRHDQDFREMLPFPEYMHPNRGALNMARCLPARMLPPDLGPRTHIALGRTREHEGEGDAVTKLHYNACDGVNVLCDAQYQGGEEAHIRVRCGEEAPEKNTYDYAAAVWDVVRREDVPKVEAYLRAHASEFVHHGQPVSNLDMRSPFHDQMFVLTERHRQALRAEQGVETWHFEQHRNEAIYVPAGCPHQVRNLRSCIKVSVNFLAPESMGEVNRLAQEMRQLGKSDSGEHLDGRHGTDQLQGAAMMAHAAMEALQVVREAEQ